MTETYLYPVYETDSWHSLSNRDCKGIYTSKEEAIEAIVEHHCIPLEEFDGLTKDEAKEKLRNDLQIPFQTQGYTVNYDIEVWFQNDWVYTTITNMKKFVIHYNYFATADVTVLANSKEEAIEKADQIELSNDEFDLQFDTREVYGSEDVPDLKEIIDKAEEIIRKFDEGAGKDDFYSVPCYPTVTTYCWNGDEMAKNKNTVEDFYYDSDKGLMMDVGEGFEVEMSELSDVEQLNVCQVIIDAAKDNGIEL